MTVLGPRTEREAAIYFGIQHAVRCIGLPPPVDWLRELYPKIKDATDLAELDRTGRVFFLLVVEGFGEYRGRPYPGPASGAGLWADRRAAAATEYAFLVGLIAVAGAIGMLVLGDGLQEYFVALGEAIAKGLEPTPDCFAKPPHCPPGCPNGCPSPP